MSGFGAVQAAVGELDASFRWGFGEVLATLGGMADSLQLLRHTAGLLADAGWMVGNVDCSVVCEQPKLAPRRDEMQQRLSAAAGAPVTVKGRRAEGLGALGRGEGIACWAVAVIQRHES